MLVLESLGLDSLELEPMFRVYFYVSVGELEDEVTSQVPIEKRKLEGVGVKCSGRQLETGTMVMADNRSGLVEREDEASRVRNKQLAMTELSRRRKEMAAMQFDDDNEQEFSEEPDERRRSAQISSQPISSHARQAPTSSMYQTLAVPPPSRNLHGQHSSHTTHSHNAQSLAQLTANAGLSSEELEELRNDPDAAEDLDAMDVDVEQQAEALHTLTLVASDQSFKRKAIADQVPGASRAPKTAKTQKGGQPAVRRPGARQAAGHHRQVLKLSLAFFRNGISTVYGFMDNDQGDDMGGQCWKKACAVKNVSLEMSDNDLRLLKERGSQLRGELKTKATPIIEQGYSLLRLSPEQTKKVQRLSDHVKALLKNVSFIYRDPRTRDGIYLNGTIYNIIVRMWFHTTRYEGIKYDEYFKPAISLACIALVLTVIENVLEEYETGVWTQKEISWGNYHRRYETHLQDLEDWEAENTEWVRQWTTHLATAARKQLRINDDDTVVSGRISASDRQEASARLSMKDLESIGAPTGYESEDDSEAAS
ncbi:hypothetical protein PHLGIDRAFT_16008 [Phlebiopsis gigantea 11061_1 CR5-6]|uniref:DUF6532 domain-containing protein n=1 Tax=Phlebiopsis gigantea (strain 11061_1 CR5-6) TaxID=745531 RepID=A0A0C3NEX9_PHLG1|nr:hypothetical protein PHLGIDRAFT_16008 [Phlebiopsis gigantea 11061_1 CR5-6]